MWLISRLVAESTCRSWTQVTTSGMWATQPDQPLDCAQTLSCSQRSRLLHSLDSIRHEWVWRACRVSCLMELRSTWEIQTRCETRVALATLSTTGRFALVHPSLWTDFPTSSSCAGMAPATTLSIHLVERRWSVMRQRTNSTCWTPFSETMTEKLEHMRHPWSSVKIWILESLTTRRTSARLSLLLASFLPATLISSRGSTLWGTRCEAKRMLGAEPTAHHSLKSMPSLIGSRPNWTKRLDASRSSDIRSTRSRATCLSTKLRWLAKACEWITVPE